MTRKDHQFEIVPGEDVTRYAKRASRAEKRAIAS